MITNTIALSRFTSRAYRRAPHRPARVVSSLERVLETNNDLYQGLNKIMKNDLQSIHEQYKRIISEANEEPRYNNGMRKIDTNHRYEYDPYTGTVKDTFGDDMANVDEYIDEMNMLMDEIRRLKEVAKEH